MTYIRDEHLWGIIKNVGEVIKKELVAMGYDIIHVSSIGAVEINPRHLVYWFGTKTDREKDELNNKSTEIEQLIHKQLEVGGYPLEAIKHTLSAFESQETVDRIFKGNWYQAMR